MLRTDFESDPIKIISKLFELEFSFIAWKQKKYPTVEPYDCSAVKDTYHELP